jgi:hypothetical protein
MALQQIIQHPTGTYSQYWKIRTLNLNHTDKTGTVILDGYVSEQARLDNKIPLDMRSLDVVDFDVWFAPAVIDVVGMNEVKSAYVFAKSIPNGEFVGSTDV